MHITIWEFLALTWEWIMAEYRTGTFNDAIQWTDQRINEVAQMVRNAINTTQTVAEQWLTMAILTTVVGLSISTVIFLLGILIGGFINAGWVNAITGLLIAPTLFILLVLWTPLAFLLGVVIEITHLRFKGAPAAAVKYAQMWLRLIAGILLWQVLVSLAFTFIPYWNAPSRIPVLMLLALAMALIGIRWNNVTWYRGVIKFLVIGAFITQVLVCFLPETATALHSSIGETDKSMAEKIKNGNLFSAKTDSAVSDFIILDSGIYNFRLDPGQTNDKWVIIQDDCQYSFSSSRANDPVKKWFFLVYKDGKMIKVDRADATIPPGPGPFKLMGGENGAYVKLLIVKRT